MIFSFAVRVLVGPGTDLLVMVALRSRCGHYIFVLFLLSFFSSPNLSGHILDVYDILTHDVVLMRI